MDGLALNRLQVGPRGRLYRRAILWKESRLISRWKPCENLARSHKPDTFIFFFTEMWNSSREKKHVRYTQDFTVFQVKHHRKKYMWNGCLGMKYFHVVSRLSYWSPKTVERWLCFSSKLFIYTIRLLSINLRGSWPSERSHSVSQVNLPVQMSVEIITT